jgi:hypothetical protein
VQRSTTTDRTLVKRLGQRFESPRRLFIFPANPIKTKSLQSLCRGLCQQYVSSRLYPNASSSALACYKWLHGTAVGAGESSGIHRLTDVPGVRGVWHRRKSFAQVPRSRIPRSSAKRSSKKFEATFRLVCRWAILELTSIKGTYVLLVPRCDPPQKSRDFVAQAGVPTLIQCL